MKVLRSCPLTILRLVAVRYSNRLRFHLQSRHNPKLFSIEKRVQKQLMVL